jgi:hypothetical protein
MQALATFDLQAASRQGPRADGLIAVASLGAGELRLVQALRAARSGGRRPLPALAPALGAALARYARELVRDDGDDSLAAATLEDSEYLSPVEARTLHAIGCMRAGLLGEAWKSLAGICIPGRAGNALVALEEVAAATAPAGPSALA